MEKKEAEGAGRRLIVIEFIKHKAVKKNKEWGVYFMEKAEIDLLFDDFYNGLIASVSDYSYEPTNSIPVFLLKRECEEEYMPNVREIAQKQYQSVERYCRYYFEHFKEQMEIKTSYGAQIHYRLLCWLSHIIDWNIDKERVKKKILKDGLGFFDGSTAMWFPVYKKAANEITAAAFKEDKECILKLWKDIIVEEIL